MNDEFLHALRRDPPPEFARELKRRLQRQRALRSSRPSILRTVLAMLLIGGVAMASALLLRDEDERPRADAPSEQQSAPIAPTGATRPPDTTSLGGQSSRGAAASQSQAPALEERRGTFATASLPRPIAQALVDSLRGDGVLKPHVAIMDDAQALRALCGNADFVMVSRRITEAELTWCWNQHIEVAEWQIGYQAVVLTAGPMAEPAALTPREVFLALARRIPDPAHPSRLIDNPNMTWHDVDSRFEHRRIDILMPSDAVTRAAFVQLVMEPGCEEYRWIREQKQTNPQRHVDVCHQLRNDDRIHEVESTSSMITQQLWAEPNWLVVLGYSYYDAHRTELLGTMLEGPVPTLESLSDGAYPAARPVYVYAQRLRMWTNAAYRSLAYALTEGRTIGWRAGLVRLDENARRIREFPPFPPPALESLKPEGAKQ